VTIDGVDVRDVTRASLLEVVTPVLQQPSLFSGTLETNIAFGASGDDQATVDVVTAARAAEAAGFIEDRPDGYRGEVKRRGPTSRAASASASRSRGRWSGARRSSSWTTPPAPSTSPPRHASRTRSAS
jgi:ABC-type protease/lipase transport system fused ATPase/permease subunit